MNTEKVHQGHNVRRFREMLSMKQEALAQELGGDWTQKRVSLLEQKETIDPYILQHVAQVLKVPVEAIEKLDEEKTVSIISNTFNTHDNSSGINACPTFNINPIEKWMEVLEENKKLYERMLESEREKTQLMKDILDKMK